MRSSSRILAVALWVAWSLSASAQNNFYLHKDDRVVFYGDSITQQYHYASFVETYVATHYPELNVRFINAGWSGEWVVGGGGGTADERLPRDVVGNKATVATFMVGMNDAAYQKFDQAFFDVYVKGYQHLLDVLQQSSPALRITLIQPSPYDDITRPGEFVPDYNSVLVRYGQFVADLAKQHNQQNVDFNAPLVAVLEKAKSVDPGLAKKIIPDQIHPGPAGGVVLAVALLKAWGAGPVVTSVELDARKARLTRAENTEVNGVQKIKGAVRSVEIDGRSGHVGDPAVAAARKAETLSWTQLDKALPLPIDMQDPVMSLAVKSSDVVETLNQQVLKVTGLPSGNYLLAIDNAEIATFTSEQLAQGTNLALLPTPMLKQALIVQDLTMRRNAVRLAGWQDVQFGLHKETSPHLAEAMAALTALEADVLAQQRQAAVPQAHHFELLPQKAH